MPQTLISKATQDSLLPRGWYDAIDLLRQGQIPQNHQMPKESFNSPLQFGFSSSPLALDVGQSRDYRIALDQIWDLPEEDNRGVHVREYDEYYEIHIDQYHPSYDPIGHLTEVTRKRPELGIAAAAIALLGVPLAAEYLSNS